MSFNIFPDKRGKPIDLAIFTSVFGDRCSFEQGYYTISRGCCQDLSGAPFLPKKAKKLLTNRGICGIIFRRAERLSMCGCGGRAISSKKTKCRCGGTADALVSGSSEEIRVGSNPVTCTKRRGHILAICSFCFIKVVGLK